MSSDKSIEEILKQVDDLEKGWDENVDRPPSDIIGHNAENADAMKSVVSKEQAPDFGENLKPDSSDPAPEAPQAPEPPTEPWARRGYELEQNRTRPPPEDPLAAKMKAAGWTPKASASAAEPDWNALQNRLQEAENRAANSRAATQSFAAVSPNQHFHYDPNIGSEDVAAAKAPLEMAQAKQAYDTKQVGLEGAQKSQASAAALADPNSPQSQRSRASVQSFIGDTAKLPSDFESYSAADVDRYLKTFMPLTLEREKSATSLAEKKATGDAKAKATQDELASRKATMLSQYPDQKEAIDALTDPRDAATLQAGLEGRLGRESTQNHSDTARLDAQRHADAEAATASARALANAKALKDYEAKNQNMSTEQKQALEGFNALPGVIDTLRNSLKETGTWQGKLGAKFPEIAGALNAPGATFESSSDAAASILARIVDGGVARPGTIEIVKHYLPRANDSEDVKGRKLKDLESYVAGKQEGFFKSLSQEGVRVPEHGAPAQANKKATAVTAGKVRMSNGTETYDVLPSDVQEAESHGFKRAQ